MDGALLAIRRFTEAPGALRAGSTLRHRPERIEISTMLVVDAIARHGDAAECSVGTVADALTVTHSTASRLVERAVKAGMVDRDRSPADPRRTVLALTAAGTQLQRDAVAFRTASLDGMLSDWAAADVKTFTRLLERFARSARPSM